MQPESDAGTRNTKKGDNSPAAVLAYALGGDMAWDQKTSDDVAYTLLKGGQGALAKPIHVRVEELSQRQDKLAAQLTRIESKLDALLADRS